MSDKIFRKAALDRLSSPEQLDRLVTVTNSRTWLALVTILVLVCAVGVWSVLGTLPTRVEGQGILINSGGRVIDVQATGSGTLSTILVAVGDEVQAGETVARLSLTEAEQNFRNAQSVVAEREAELRRTRKQVASEREVRGRSADRRKQALEANLVAVRPRRDYLNDRLADLQALMAKGIVTRQAVAEARDQATRAGQEVAELQSNLLVLDSERLERDIALDNRVGQAEEELAEAKRALVHRKASLARSTVVKAPASGRVTEIKAVPGTLVAQGQSLFTFQSGRSFLELTLYVPARQGKRVKSGMPVQVSPSTARREEYGTVFGTVDYVSEFPATMEGMRAVLQNDELARTFSQSGTPYMARILLKPDPDTVSGYDWSSSRGEALALTGGTLASGQITVAERAPISLVIPLLREMSGLGG